MSDNNSLIDIGKLAEPARVLIEKISDAIGGLYKPRQIVRVANAEAEAELIRAQAQIEISALQRRALERFVAEEAKKQENIEKITQKAIPHLTDSSTPQNIEDDWISNFFDKCRIVSDEEMQSLWAKVLAGEANLPGSFSKRTVNFLSSLDKNDAQLFTNLCKFAWQIGSIVPLIYDVLASIYNEQAINFASLSHLDAIGLIRFDPLAGFRNMRMPQISVVYYYGEPLILKFSAPKDNELQAGKVLFTQTGLQLAPICGSTASESFHDYIITKWMNENLKPVSPFPKGKISFEIEYY